MGLFSLHTKNQKAQSTLWSKDFDMAENISVIEN